MTSMHENLLAFFNRIGPWEIGITLGLILLLFGGKKLPELARGLARGLRTFRDEMKGIKTDIEKSVEEGDKASAAKDKPGEAGKSEKGPDEKK